MARISICTGAVVNRDSSVEEFIAGYTLLRECGFSAVDCGIDTFVSYSSIVKKEVDPMWLTDTDEVDLAPFERWKIASEKTGVENYQAHAPFPSCDYSGDTEYTLKLRNMYKKYIHICSYIGCRHLVIHPQLMPMPEPLTPAEAEEMNIDFYSALIPYAKKYNVNICLENMFCAENGRIYASTCSDIGAACRYIDRLNSIAGEKCFSFCLDIGHLALVGKNVKNAIIQLGDRIEALHIHDNNGITDQHWGPYMGSVDWDGFTEGLKAIRYPYPLSFEVGVKWIDRELLPEQLKLISAAGRMFARRAELD